MSKKTKKLSVVDDIHFTCYCPSCGTELREGDDVGARCRQCGRALASVRPDDLSTFLVTLRGCKKDILVRAESVSQVRALLAHHFTQDHILHVAKVDSPMGNVNPLVQESAASHLARSCTRLTEGRSLAVTCLIHCRHNVLMGWHIGRDGWGFPGGAQQKNEFVRDAVVREVAEETGLALQSDKLSFQGWDESAEDWFNLAFSYELDSLARVAVQAEGKHREWQWFPLECLPEPLNSLAAGLFLHPWFSRWESGLSWH